MKKGLFYLFTSLFWGSLYAYMSFMTPYAKSLGASEVMVGMIVGGYGLVQMLLRIPLGILSDKLRRRKPFLLLGMGAALIAALGMWLFPSAGGLLFFRSFAGVAAATWVTTTVLFSNYFDPKDAPKALGRLQSANVLGNMLAALAGAQLAQRAGESSAFVLAIILGVVGLIVALFLKEKRPESTKPLAIGDFVKVGADPLLLAVSICGILLQLVSLGSSGSFTQQWARDIGMTTGQLGYLSLCASLPNMAGSLLCGTIFTRYFKPHRLIMVGSGMIAVCVSLIPFTTTMAQLLVLQGIQGFGSGLVMPMLMGLSIAHMPVEKRGAAMGFFQSIYALGMTIGPVLSGAISQHFALSASFWVMGGAGVILFLLSAFLLPRKAG